MQRQISHFVGFTHDLAWSELEASVPVRILWENVMFALIVSRSSKALQQHWWAVTFARDETKTFDYRLPRDTTIGRLTDSRRAGPEVRSPRYEESPGAPATSA